MKVWKSIYEIPKRKGRNVLHQNVLIKVNTYSVWIDGPSRGGFSIGINEWRNISSGETYFCWAELVNYMEITMEQEAPFEDIEGHAIVHGPGLIRGETIEEVIENIKQDIENAKTKKERKIQARTEAVRLMRKHIFKNQKIGEHAKLQLRVMGFDLKKLSITTKILNNMKWEHVFNNGRKVVWHHNNDNIWEAKSKDPGGAQSLMYIEDGTGKITLERDS
jgi:Cft2 family RNA processing exonuclease